MNTLLRWVLLSVVVVSASPALAVRAPAPRTGAVPLPPIAVDHAIPAAARSKTGSWGQFLERYPTWFAQWNSRTGTPHRAMGKGIQVTGPVTSKAQATNAGLAFLRRESQLTKASGAQIVSKATLKGGRVWYVHFDQHYQGVPVLNADITVRLGEDGKIFAFGSEIHSKIGVSTKPSLDVVASRTLATAGLAFDPSVDVVTGGEDLYILPIETDTSVDYALVRHVHVSQQNPRHEWEVMVDAHDGRIRWRWDRVRYGSVSGTITSKVHPLVPSDPLVTVATPDTWINVDGTIFTTDAMGDYLSTTAAGNSFVGTDLRGPYANINNDGGPEAILSINVDADTDPVVNFQFDDNNSTAAERDAYHNTLIAHDWIKDIDPGFTEIDYSMIVNVNIDATCNAFWDGSSINFYESGNGCNNTAEMADVVYHEYGHGINDKLYEQAGASMGMTNGAMHEALADVTAALMTDDQIIGDEFFVGGGFVRDIGLGNAYPQDVTGQVHNDGLILGGAFWNLRQLLGLELARDLAHFPKYGLPDHPSTLRLAYGEFYQEMLIYDDDDSDLSNGTPHMAEINQAFAAHGIGPSLFLFISHLAEPNASANTPIPVTIQVFSQSPLYQVDESQLKVVYTVDDGPAQELALSNLFLDFFDADIPGQPSGSIVRYHFEAQAVGGTPVTKPIQADEQPYIVVVGEQVDVVLDDFQTDTGWTVGAPDDDATTGVWERANPEGTGVQPENDHTLGAGTLCWVTGAANPNPQNDGANDVDGGKTTLTSPLYDLTGLMLPVVEWYRFFSNGFSSDPWVAQISNDGGANWVDVENTTQPIRSWFRVVFKLEDVIAATDQMQFRFIARDEGSGSLVEALLDDFHIFDFADLPTGVLAGDIASKRLTVNQNRPNPFNPATEISFELPAPGPASVTVYDLSGRLVRSLVRDDLPAGPHSVQWLGRDDRGQPVASGVYLYSVEAGGMRQTRRMVLAK